MTQLQRYMQEVNEGHEFYELGKDPFGWMVMALVAVMGLAMMVLERLFG